jgi:hypothetical protein
MSRQRLVDTCFWDDNYILSLDPSEKLLFLYLLTNPLTTICGVYEISIKRMAFDTGFDQDTVQRMLERLERDLRCIYRDGWVAMRNWLKHQNAGSPKVQKGIEIQLGKVPDELADYVSGEGIDTLSHINSNSNSNSNSNPNTNESEEPATPAPTAMPKFSFSFEEGFVGIPYEDMKRWTDTYPAVNIAGEIKKAAEWMRSNPTKRKSNYRRFLTNWFSRTQEHGGTAGYRPPTERPAASQLVKPEPLTDSERKENLSALSELTRQMAKEKRVLPAGGKR